MKVEKLAIPEVLLITPVRHGDERGWFMETYSAPRLAAAGISDGFVQDNQSFSRERGTVRGLHCQLAPFVQGKLVRVLRGAIFDVVVDARAGSPNYGRHVAALLSAQNAAQIWVPPGFLHGFCTTEPDTEIAYKVSAPYDRDSERGVLWMEPALGIDWPVQPSAATLSDRDRALPGWDPARPWFQF